MKVQSTASPLPPVPTSSSECESSSESESLSESSQLDVNEAWGNNIHFIENDKDFAEKSDESKARKAAESREFARTYELSIQYQHHLIKRFKRLLTMGGDNEEDVKNGEQAENKMEEANEEKELEDEKDENKYNELSILSPPSIAYNSLRNDDSYNGMDFRQLEHYDNDNNIDFQGLQCYGAQERISTKLRLPENVYSFKMIDDLPTNIKQFRETGNRTHCKIPNVDGVDYMLLVNVEALGPHCGLGLFPWSEVPNEEKLDDNFITVNKNCLIVMMTAKQDVVIRISPSQKQDKLAILNIDSSRRYKSDVLAQGYAHFMAKKNMNDNLKSLNTNELIESNKIEGNVYHLPYFGLFIKRQKKNRYKNGSYFNIHQFKLNN